jgi:hypothetical protein
LGTISKQGEEAKLGALRDFVADLLESQGAALEPQEPDGLDVVAPEPVRSAFGWPELVRLGFGPQLPSGATPVGLEGDWLDRFGALLGTGGRFAERQLVLPHEVMPPSDAERLIDRSLELPNAVWRLRKSEATWTRSLLLAFHYAAVSDEKREGLIWLGLNCATGAVLSGDLLGRLRASLAVDLHWRVPEPETCRAAGPIWDVETLSARVKPLVEHHVRRDLEPFLRAMRRRLGRDRARVHAYHDDLRRSAQLKLVALQSAVGVKVEADRKREMMRVQAIEREYAAKIEDLRHHYALRVTINWVQGLTLVAPVHRYKVLIKRRKGERIVAIDWHPAARMMEPPPCDWGLGLERARLVCDDRLHLTDLGAQAPCPSCGKAWCRACHCAACPRCGQAQVS